MSPQMIEQHQKMMTRREEYAAQFKDLSKKYSDPMQSGLTVTVARGNNHHDINLD
jgi:hypothetical protein